MFPTDTLYGLGADVFSIQALEQVFVIKGRPPRLALPVLVAGWDQLEMVVQPMGRLAGRLARRFWPGLLTLVMPRAYGVPALVTGGGATVAVRMPGHAVPLEIARKLGRPITGTSANRSGETDPATLDGVEAELGHLVDHIVRAGPAPGGRASTVVDVTGGAPRLLRQGALPFREVLAAVK